MSNFAKSLKRLYKSGQLPLETIKKLYATSRITKEEYTYIVMEETD